MASLKKELSLIQGVGLLSTSLLGSGIFAVPALVALQSGNVSLWAWPVLLVLFIPVALTFAALGRYFPSAGGAAHFVGTAFGPRAAQATGWLFLSVIPVGVPAALQIASGFWQAIFPYEHTQLVVQIATIIVVGLLGLKGAGSSANIQSIIAVLIIVLIGLIWFKGGITPANIPVSPIKNISASVMFDALAIMFWCFVGIEAFAHMAEEFKNPEKDFHRAVMIGLFVAGFVYWSCTVAVLFFGSYGKNIAAAASLPNIIKQLFGNYALWAACIVGYLACFASINVYAQSFARLIWSQAQIHRPDGWFARLSKQQTPINALSAVLACCLAVTLLVYVLHLSLDVLIVYANGIFITIYLLCMLSGCRLLKGRIKVMAYIGSLLSIIMLMMIGWKSLIAISVFLLLLLIEPYVSRAKLEKTH